MRKLGLLIATVVMLLVFGAQGAFAEEGVPLKQLAAGTVFNFNTKNGPLKVTIDKMEGVSIQRTMQGTSVSTNESVGFGVGLSPARQETMDKESREAVAKLYPLKVGNAARMMHRGIGAGGEFISTDKMEVTGTKKVTVPAGTFDTYVIETSMFGNKGGWKGWNTCWYAPEVGYCVKGEWRSSGSNDDLELVSVVLP